VIETRRAAWAPYPRGVTDAENWLLKTRLRELHARLATAPDPGAADAAWREAEAAVAAASAGEEADVALPVLERDVPALGALLAAWDARTLPLTEWDQAVLKRALNAYKRRLKLTRADDEFSSSRNPMSRGNTSGILGTRPPEQYPRDVWDLLIAQGRLKDGGDGLLEPGGNPG
jgi:hypothetical protein